MKLSNPQNDKPRFEIPGRGFIAAASAVLALLSLAGLLSRPLIAPSPQPTPPPIPPPMPTESAEPTPIVAPKPSRPAEDLPNPGCAIKGNISQKSGEHIYHLPGQFDYGRTVISPEKGERWFCTEEEARAAGWRKARR